MTNTTAKENKMTAKHTPGPWRVDIFSGDPGIPRSQGGGQKIRIVTETFPVEGLRVATASCLNIPLDVTKANATLISTAPELLEALKDARQEIITLTDGQFNDRLEAIDSLIAKAEGR